MRLTMSRESIPQHMLVAPDSRKTDGLGTERSGASRRIAVRVTVDHRSVERPCSAMLTRKGTCWRLNSEAVVLQLTD